MEATNVKLWIILGEYADKLKKMASDTSDPNRAALLDLASQLLGEMADSILDYRIRRSQLESLDRLIRLFKTFGLPSNMLTRIRRLVIRYVEVHDSHWPLVGANDMIGIPA